MEAKLMEQTSGKYEDSIKNIEDKVRVMESGREEMIKVNGTIQREMETMLQSVTQREIEVEKKLMESFVEITNLQKLNSSLTTQHNKLLADIAIKETLIEKLVRERDEMIKEQEALYMAREQEMAMAAITTTGGYRIETDYEQAELQYGMEAEMKQESSSYEERRSRQEAKAVQEDIQRSIQASMHQEEKKSWEKERTNLKKEIEEWQKTSDSLKAKITKVERDSYLRIEELRKLFVKVIEECEILQKYKNVELFGAGFTNTAQYSSLISNSSTYVDGGANYVAGSSYVGGGALSSYLDRTGILANYVKETSNITSNVEGTGVSGTYISGGGVGISSSFSASGTGASYTVGGSYGGDRGGSSSASYYYSSGITQ
jgi:hypothetical protein